MYPLTNPQKLIYNMEQYVGGPIAVICGSILVDGEIAPFRLADAIREIFRLNDVLRTRIVERDGMVCQQAVPYESCAIDVLHFDSETQLHSYAESCAKEPISLSGKLCDIQAVFLPNRFGFIVKCHHIIGDAWTLTLICSQFNAILAGEQPTAFSYSDYVESESAYLQSSRCAKDRAFFMEQFKTCDDVTYLADQNSSSYVAERITFSVSTDQTAQIRSYAKQHNASPFVLFLTAVAVYFSRVKMNVERFYIGTPLLNRGTFKEKNTTGMFINTVPVLANVDYTHTFADNLAAMQREAFSVLRHQKFHYNDLLTAIRQEFGFTEQLYDVVLSYQNAVVHGAVSKVETTWYHNGLQTESLQIHIDDRDGENAFRIHLDYRTDKFTSAEIERIYTHILNLLLDAITDDSKKPGELELLPVNEKQQLLLTFNDTTVDYPRDKCVHELFEEQAEKNPDKTVVIACDRTLTYQELNEEANHIAHGLIDQGVKPGDIVAFALPRNSHLIPTMFGILKAGAAYLPIDPDYPQERISYMLGDSRASFFITGDNICTLLRNERCENPRVPLSSKSLCYCIYTSGTTGNPKGVLIRHSNLVNFCNTKASAYHEKLFNAKGAVLSTFRACFDGFGVDSILPTLFEKTIALPNEQCLTDAGLLSNFAVQSGCTVIQGTPTTLRAFCASDAFRSLLYSSELLLFAAELFTPAECLYFRALTKATIINGYGPTETTIGASFGEVIPEKITIGRPIANTQIHIVDKYLNPVPIGVTGELCIAGDGVGAGYLNRPELTAEKFIDNPFGEGKLYKTGDLAYWREDGNIVYVGRNDFQVKIRGLRIELGEIENAIAEVDGVSQAVVIVRKDDTGRQLICAFYTETAPVELDAIKTSLREKLPRYMMPHIFTRLDTLPMTTSGKVNRKALPDVDLSVITSEAEYVAPATREESALAGAVAEVLRIEKVGMLDNFFTMGGDSLKAIELTAALERQGYQVSVKAIFAADTLGELAAQLEPSVEEADIEVPTGDIPATDAQMRVYTAQSVSGGTAYNVPYAFKVKGLDPICLQAAIDKLIARHEILRTRFENRDGVIVQVADDGAVCKVESLPSDDLLAFIRPFDLDTAPLLRVGYYQNTVMLDMHHIITDGGSMPTFLRELNEFYMDRDASKAPVQYRAFAAQKHDLTESEQYWLSVFEDEPPVLELNTDYPRGNRQTFTGSALYETISVDLHSKICAKSQRLGITPYTFYMGAFHILLSKFGGGEDIVVGTPASGRSGRFLNTLGMFVNTLALRSHPEGEKTVAAFLHEVKDAAAGALDHQIYPYGELVKKLGIQSGNRNPLFDVMFAYQSEEMSQVVFGDEAAELLPIPVTTSKYDFTFNVMPRSGDVVLMAEYCTDLYKEQTMKRLVEGYQLLLTQMLDTEKSLNTLTAMSEVEQRTLLFDFNDTSVDYPRDKCVHQLFEEQVEKNPDKTAVIACDRTLTYQELNEEANRIAHGLIDQGVKPGDIVAFALPRNSHLIPTMFGILKAGAAYLPIDPDYPQERISYMLRDSEASFFITGDNIGTLLRNECRENPCVPLSSESLCYCIYTSGTTGNPKGALISHKNLLNFCSDNSTNNLQHYIALNGQVVLACGSITFDISNFEIVLSLLLNKSVVLADENALLNSGELASLIVLHGIDCIHCTPTRLRVYLGNPIFSAALHQVKCIMVGGEQLTDEVLQLMQKYGSAKIFNGYGPTETTMGVCFGEAGTAIGHPIANTQIYIVDKYINPVPVGVTGELCIAGDGVGAGYLNRPELAAEKFISNPFGRGKLYKTGDLAYWREDGNIVYVGRNDFQVKIRGLRIELGEIENTITGVHGVSQAVVIVRKDDTGRQLICAFYTETAPVELDAIKTALRERLPRYMMPHIFTRLDTLPMTTSGKVNRKALPDVDLSVITSEVEYVAPATREESALAGAVAEVLRIEKVGMLDNFFTMGGDSLKAIELTAVLERQGYQVSVKAIFAADTLGELAVQLEPSVTEADVEVPAGDIPATDAQMRVYTAQSISGGTAYNVPYAFRVKGLDSLRLQTAVNQMISRHEILRTRFENQDGQIMQVLDDTAVCIVEALDSDDPAVFIRPFDLDTAPLLRVGYYQDTVMLDMHHIITDGGSMPTFLRELNEFYMDRDVPESPVQYRAFAALKNDFTKSEQYWLSVFDDEPPVLELNTDYPRGNRQTFSGSALYETISAGLHTKICGKCQQLGITPYAFYMGAFHILLSKFGGGEDIVIGTPASGRSGKFLNALGMFVNTLALRSHPEGEKTVAAFLREVKDTIVEALENQTYPYGELVKKLGLQSGNRNPLFDVMFAYQSEEMSQVVFGDEPAELLPIPITTSKYDFTFNVMPRSGDVVLMAEYCTELYKEQTMKRFVEGYQLLLAQMLEETRLLKGLSALSEQERNTLLHDFNDTTVDYPRDKYVHQLFEEQVEKTPNKTAVIACDCTLTYQELNEEANRIAHGLIGQGVKPGDIVAFALPRNSNLIPAMFGILKAGAAYLPIDPDYPQGRISYMLEDSQSKLLITEENILDLLRNDQKNNPTISIANENLCYCIYTSGTTGQPKGILIAHRNVTNFVQSNEANMFQKSILSCCEYFVSANSLSFDITLQEIHLPLLNGRSIILLSDEQIYDIGKSEYQLKRKNCGLIITPTKLGMYMANQTFCDNLQNITCIMCGAETFTQQLRQQIQKYTNAVIFNGYGPTETTCGVLYSKTEDAADITIGRPIANTQIYIVDKYLNPVPIGVTGELCIAGDGVGVGYLNRPELTAEKFIDNPFGEGKLYKTGDLAYWREDGNIVYVGRNDFQVKIRGLRIELGEIESTIAGVDGVSQAVVVVRKDDIGRQLICAFYTETTPVELDAIKTTLREKLPRYMMPHIFTRLDTLPMTTSGKVNRKALPEVDLSAIQNDIEYVSPDGQCEKALATIMEQVLGYSPVGRDDNFFDLGGDSLKAIEFVSKAHADGIYFSLQNVFDCPTIKTLRQCIENGNKADFTYENVDFTEIDRLLSKNRLDKSAVPPKTDVGNIFLAGATGFLGIHILANYLEHDTGTAYCLVRGRNQADSESRLAKLLKFYFGGQYSIGGRIQVVCGDLQKETFGLTEVEYQALLGKIDTVINAAASVKHYGSYRYFYEANVESVSKLVSFCKDGRAKLIHVSTLSVSGNGFDTFDSYISEMEMHFYESNLYIGQPIENVYARSKFEAEKLILEEMTNGLPANIMRMGNLTNRFSDGMFQINHETNAAAQRIKGILELGMMPDYLIAEDMYVEFTPIDEAVQAIMTIARHFSTEQTVFHINSTKVVYLDQLIDFFCELGCPLKAVSGADFTAALRKTAKQAGLEHIFETFINDLDKNDRLNYDSNIRIENAFSEEYLRRLGFTWSEIGIEYLRKYVAYFRKIGYWGV